MNSYAPWCPSDSKSMEGFAEWPFTAVHLCYHAISVGWVDGLGPSKNKIHLHKIKCWGLTPFYFRSARFFLFFFRGAHPHSLGVRHRRIIIDVVEESLALRNRFKLIACVQALTHTTAKFPNDCTLQSPYNYCCCKIIAITVAGIQYTRVYCSLNMFRYKITCIYILYI